MIFYFDNKTFYQFVSIFLNTILFGELEINKKKFPNFNNNKNIVNEMNYFGSSFFNSV